MLQAKTKLSEEGRVLIPASYRKALDLQPGDELMLVLDEGELRLLPMKEAIRQAQAIVRQYVPKGRSLSEELIAERRRESELE